MSDNYNCPYCGKVRHQLNPGPCPTCNDKPNYADDLRNTIKTLELKCKNLKLKIKKLEDKINGPKYLGQGI